MKWHALILAGAFLAAVLPTVRSVCAFRNQDVYFVTFFFPFIQHLWRKIVFNNVILYMASGFVSK